MYLINTASTNKPEHYQTYGGAKAISKLALFVLAMAIIFAGVVAFVAFEMIFEPTFGEVILGEVICKFSGGGGETTTETFHLKNRGLVELLNYSIKGYIEADIYRVGEDEPLASRGLEIKYWGDVGWIHDDWYMLEPGDYYLVVRAGARSSWTIVVHYPPDTIERAVPIWATILAAFAVTGLPTLIIFWWRRRRTQSKYMAS